MKPFGLMTLLLIIFILVACHLPVSTTPTPTFGGDSLETAEAYLARGDQYSEIQDYDHAILDYDQVLRLKPDYAEAYNNRGYAYYWKGDAAHAIADYTRAIELRPHYAYAFNNRGAAYMASAHPDQAILDFDQAIQLQPDFPQAYTNRGNAYLRTGQFALAMADFERAGQDPVGGLVRLSGLFGLIMLLGVLLIRRCRFAPIKTE